MDLRPQDVAAVDAACAAAERHVVARRAPGGLFLDGDVRHLVFGEEALLLGDDERGGIGERNVAEARAGDLGTRAGGMGAGRQQRLGGEEGRGGASPLQEGAAPGSHGKGGRLRPFHVVPLWSRRHPRSVCCATKKPPARNRRPPPGRALSLIGSLASSARRWTPYVGPMASRKGNAGSVPSSQCARITLFHNRLCLGSANRDLWTSDQGLIRSRQHTAPLLCSAQGR